MEEIEEGDYWGVDLDHLKQENPPIYRGKPVYKRTNDRVQLHINNWNLDSLKCSDFLIAMFYWQAACGTLPYGGSAYIDESILSQIQTEWNSIAKYQNIKIYGGAGQSICVHGLPESLELIIGCNNKEALNKIEAKIKCDWRIYDG